MGSHLANWLVFSRWPTIIIMPESLCKHCRALLQLAIGTSWDEESIIKLMALSSCACPKTVIKSVSQSVSQSFSQSASQSISQPVSQSVSQSVSQTVSQSVSQSINQSISQLVKKKGLNKNLVKDLELI